MLNRGNYRRDVFEAKGAGEAFIRVLQEATAMFGWRVYGYVVMRNHYHVALETPKANLVDGMHGLQETIAARFNRLRKVQGRYQAILLEDVGVLTWVVNFIHLNPVRAQIVTAAKAKDYHWSSLNRFVKGLRFKGLTGADWLGSLGLSDTQVGRQASLDELSDLAADSERQKQEGYATLSRGWAIGTLGWRKALAQDHAHRAISPGLEAAQKREIKEARWTNALQALMANAGKTHVDALRSQKGDRWKINLARQLRKQA